MSIEPEMVNCTHCGSSIEAKAIFCRFCFSGLSPRHFRACPTCTEIIRRDTVICRFCKTSFPPAPVVQTIPESEEMMAAKFRQTFVAEISNVIDYSESIGDAIFMLVNIIGRALQVSRCLIYCTDSAHAVWTYSEYWDRETVKGCRESNWRASKSALVARTVLATEPLILAARDTNRLTTPIQDELELLEIKSVLAVALSGQRSQGCLILQQCDYSREWASDDIGWIQNIASVLAESLASLENSDTESD
jgi:transcriptional regulator with GAF, ATPase, and Fis domain